MPEISSIVGRKLGLPPKRIFWLSLDPLMGSLPWKLRPTPSCPCKACRFWSVRRLTLSQNLIHNQRVPGVVVIFLHVNTIATVVADTVNVPLFRRERCKEVRDRSTYSHEKENATRTRLSSFMYVHRSVIRDLTTLYIP